MATTLTIDELEREILYLREQNKKILLELSTVIEENAALREKLHVQVEGLTEGYGAFEGKRRAKIEEGRNNPKVGCMGLSTFLN